MTLDEFNKDEKITVPTFIVPVKYYEVINELNDKDAGELFKALFLVAKNPDDSSATDRYFFGWQKAIFDMMKTDIIADSKKYRRMVIRNRTNGKNHKGKK